MVPEKVKALFEKESLVAFGTADSGGEPNVSVVYWKKWTEDGRILFVDNYMGKSKENVLANGKVCISFWNPETEEAYKIKGTAVYHAEGPVFEEGKAFIQEKKPDRVPKGIVEIKISEVFEITPGENAGKKL